MDRESVVLVRELSAEPGGGFRVAVEFGSRGGGEAVVSDPATPAQEELLAWYFEEHLRYPFLDRDRASEAVRVLGGYGRELFGQVFAGEAAFGYRQVRDVGFDGFRLVVQGSAAFQRLHWETLCDPDGGRLLALRMPLTRRVDRLPLPYTLPEGLPTLNILVVTARPDGARDVGYRTISQPLLDAIGRTTTPVTVDIVRPGTWEALRDSLRASAREHGQGWYQVVHFDVHGGFGTQAALASGAPAGRYLFDGPVGPGRHGFLFFETGTAGQARPVPSRQVAELLAEHRVAVAVLNACQSAMQEGSEASLAQDLVAAGAPVAVGMAYSVTVSAAERAMPRFYERLAAGDDPAAAAWAARQCLHDEKTRRGYFEQDLELEDWVLPVLFGQRDSALRLRAMTGAERDVFYGRQAATAVAPQVEYGFVGRDLDIHALERRLLLPGGTNVALVRGMAGAGKSTLLAHVGWWWQRTGLVDRVFSFSYEHRAWTADQILREIARVVLSPVEFAGWEAMSPDARTGQLTVLLRATRHLLVLDNAESVNAGPAAIPHALSDPERDRLARLVAALRGGRTLILIGSREDEAWLNPGPAYALPGLDPQAASVLTERILTRHGGAQYLTEAAGPAERRALEALTRILGGYPLPMTVVLPQLAGTAPSQILAEFTSGGDTADPAHIARRAVEYSHGKLDPALQRSMLLLAPFTATIPAPLLDFYQSRLDLQDAVRGDVSLNLGTAAAELVRVGLAADHPVVSGGWLQIVPTLPFFLRSRLSELPLLRAAADRAHYSFYADAAPTFEDRILHLDPGERLAGLAVVKAEYANLTAALAFAQRERLPVLHIVRALDAMLRVSHQHEVRRRMLDEAIAVHPPAETREQKWELLDLHNMAGGTAKEQGRLADAERHYQIELAMKQEIGVRDIEAITYHQLGTVALDRRDFALAERHFRQALELNLEFDRQIFAAGNLHDLGNTFSRRQNFGEAESCFQQALAIRLRVGDRHGAAVTHHGLGIVALQLGNLDQAEVYGRKALETWQEFDDPKFASEAHYQLGVVAAAQGRPDRADRHLRQALELRMSIQDEVGAASIYYQLGMLALAQDRHEEAERYLRQARDLHRLAGVPFRVALTCLSLGTFLLDRGRHTEALVELLAAAQTWIELDGSLPEAFRTEIRRARKDIPAEVFARSLTSSLPPQTRRLVAASLDTDQDRPGER